MRWILLIAIGMLSATTLCAETCSDYDASYTLALEYMNDRSPKSARDRYDISNKVIDSGLRYLSYCKDEIRFGDQHQIRQTIKRADKQRRDYFIGAVREYHNIYGIKPKVTEIYQQ